MKIYLFAVSGTLLSAALLLATCAGAQSTKETPISRPLVTHRYTADPSARVFNGRIYIYPSHDIETGVKEDENGAHFAMRDYHVFSMDSPTGQVTDHGVALALEAIPWAGQQLWAPDAAYKNGTYYLYFPAKDRQGVFRIGVATSASPTGPFRAEKEPISGAFSIDPCVFPDADGSHYLYVGGIWGGQLQRWATGTYQPDGPLRKGDEPALLPKVAKLAPDMKQLAEPLRDVQLLDENGNPFLEKDKEKRFFEAAWVHRYGGKYYFSYSTGDTHRIVYGVGDSPYGPFRYRGVILEPVRGWTTHHSIVETGGKWYLFYHDVELSGKTHLRNMKVTELTHRADGTIVPITPYR
jgi:hypothetical protein